MFGVKIHRRTLSVDRSSDAGQVAGGPVPRVLSTIHCLSNKQMQKAVLETLRTAYLTCCPNPHRKAEGRV